MTVKELKEQLAALPDDAIVFAYESGTGANFIAVRGAKLDVDLGYLAEMSADLP
jgi:hypothetical protein